MLTESWLLSKVGTTIFTRGKDYLSEGLIEDTTRKGQMLIAHVQGSRYKPYRVTINFDDQNGVEEADCTCPYGEEWSGWCKHIVAVLLHEIQEARHNITPPQKNSPVNVKAILRDVEAAFDELEADPYNEDTSILDEALADYTQQAQSYFAKQDPDAALTLLSTFLLAFLAALEDYDYDYDDACDFQPLDIALGGALLRGKLTPEQHRAWLESVQGWHEQTAAFSISHDILQNEPDQLDKLKREERETTQVRVAWFEEQKKWDEALILATLTAWHAQIALCLIALKRHNEAEPIIQANASTIQAEEALRLVEALQAADSRQALRVGRLLLPYRLIPDEEGLCDFEYEVSDVQVKQLALLVRSLSEAQGIPDGIIEALQALILTEPDPTLWKEYAAWVPAEAQDRLLKRLAGAREVTQALLDILTANQRWSEAWNAAQRCYEPGVRESVARSVVAHLPEPVRSYARTTANPIIEGNKSSQYDTAAFWLARERDADIALGEGKRWNMRLALLKEQNIRKYKLMPLLKALELAPEDETPPVAPTPPTERKRLVFKVN